MSTQTPNLHLDLREGTDIFNPLSTNSNFETLDSVITEIRKKGGVPTYTTTASANLLKLSENPVPNETLFKFVAAGDANTWSFQETVNNIVTLDGKQKTVKGGEMYVAWVNAANAMVVVAWPDVVNAQTFDGKGPTEWASKAQLDAVNQTAANATQTAQAAATVANNALEAVKQKGVTVYANVTQTLQAGSYDLLQDVSDAKFFIIYFTNNYNSNKQDFSTILDPAWSSTNMIGITIGSPCFLTMRKISISGSKMIVGDGENINMQSGAKTNVASVAIPEKIVAFF